MINKTLNIQLIYTTHHCVYPFILPCYFKLSRSISIDKVYLPKCLRIKVTHSNLSVDTYKIVKCNKFSSTMDSIRPAPCFIIELILLVITSWKSAYLTNNCSPKITFNSYFQWCKVRKKSPINLHIISLFLQSQG